MSPTGATKQLQATTTLQEANGAQSGWKSLTAVSAKPRVVKSAPDLLKELLAV